MVVRSCRAIARSVGSALRHGRDRCPLRNRQSDDEGSAAMMAIAFHPHAAVMQVYEVPNNRQPQTETALRARRRAISLAETIENVREEFRFDSDSGIAD